MPVRIVGPDVQGLDVASGAISAGVNITATTSATANTAITAGPAYFPGGTYDVLVFIPSVTKGTTNIDIELFLDAVFNQAISGHLTGNVAIPGLYWLGRVTLVDGVHTFTVRAFVDAGTGVVNAGNGATGNSPNALLIIRAA